VSADAPRRTRLSVAVVQGGPSAEAEVSRASARAVADALKEAGHAVIRVELDGYLAESIRTGGHDVVFPAVHGAVGEDGALQGLLEVLDVPYVGSRVLPSALAMDKRSARRVFAEAGLPIARGLAAARGVATSLAFAARARREIGARLVVKPAASGSAIGVARLDASATDADVAAAIDAAWALDDVAIVEHYARGREVTCGVLDVVDRVERHGPGARAFPPTEIVTPSDAFYTYQARYAPGRSVHQCPAALAPAVFSRVQAIAVAAHEALGCRDLSRADFVVGDDDDASAITLLEVNTMPGFTGTSLYPEAAAAFGLSFPALCDALVRSAHTRGTSRRNAPLPLPRS
jgi:D-alanine-D-alanine ligase